MTRMTASSRYDPLLLYRAGYIVGKYVSIEKMIGQSKETYDERLRDSSQNWREESNDDAPFVRYMLGVVVAAYREVSAQARLLTTKGLSKPDRIREIIKISGGRYPSYTWNRERD